MFWHLKNRIKEETGNDVDLIPSIVNANQSKIENEKYLHGSSTSLGSFTIDSSNEDEASKTTLDVKLADGKVLTQREFKKLESKEDEWRKKLEKKEEKLVSKLKIMEETWKKQLEDKEKELKEVLEKSELEKKLLIEERDNLQLKNAMLEECSIKATDYQKKMCQYQEDIDQLQGFQTQEMAKIKHLLLVKEQELSDRDKLVKENNMQIKSLKLEISRLRHYEEQYENSQDDLERMRHGFDIERAQLLSKLAEKEEDVRHLKDKVVLLEERANSCPIGEMTVDERVQKLLGERALFERRLEEAHLHLSQIKSSWSSKIESLETQVGRLCRQASEESSDKRQAECERDQFKARLADLEMELEMTKVELTKKDSQIEMLESEKTLWQDEMNKLKVKQEEHFNKFSNQIKAMNDEGSDLQSKLDERTKDLDDRKDLITRLEAKVVEQAETVSSLESSLAALKAELERERKIVQDLSSGLEEERRQKDEMMMRNAQISQHVELARQDLRKQEMESNELQTKISDLENGLKATQKDLERVRDEKLELNAKVIKLEKIQQDHQFSSSLEKELKEKIVDLENELFEKNKNIKILQQRLSDMKKTLQRELKVSSTLIDPGGPDSDGPTSYSSASSSSPAVLKPVSTQHLTVSSRYRGDEAYEETCNDVNFKYLKHVLMKFLTSRECEAQHLTRAVATLLRFSAEEEKLLKETLEWKMSWFGTKPNLGNGQTAKTIPPR